MRVAGGAGRGKRLIGAVIPGARPTSELVRGAIFNILGALDLTPIRALDLYAGSGSLGIEALSRGADWADFVERHPRQCGAARENLEATGYSHKARVYCMEAIRALTVMEGGYHLVLMDPPYRLTTVDEVLKGLAASELLEDKAIVVVGHSKRLSLEASYHSLVRYDLRRYGDSMVDFFEQGVS